MSLDMNLAPYPQIYVRIKLTILPGSEPPVPSSQSLEGDYAMSYNFVQIVLKLKHS